MLISYSTQMAYSCLQVTQIFLLIMVGLRVNAATDGRCAKFWSMALTAAILAMNVLTELTFFKECYLAANSLLEKEIAEQGWKSIGWLRSTTTIWLSTPMFAACCAGIGWALNVMTPVPEIFPDELCDEEQHGYSQNHLHDVMNDDHPHNPHQMHKIKMPMETMRNTSDVASNEESGAPKKSSMVVDV